MGTSSDLTDSGYSLEEQDEIYSMVLQDVYDNARWYLDNIDKLKSFRVGWHFYNSKVHNIPLNRCYSYENVRLEENSE